MNFFLFNFLLVHFFSFLSYGISQSSEGSAAAASSGPGEEFSSPSFLFDLSTPNSAVTENQENPKSATMATASEGQTENEEAIAGEAAGPSAPRQVSVDLEKLQRLLKPLLSKRNSQAKILPEETAGSSNEPLEGKSPESPASPEPSAPPEEPENPQRIPASSSSPSASSSSSSSSRASDEIPSNHEASVSPSAPSEPPTSQPEAAKPSSARAGLLSRLRDQLRAIRQKLANSLPGANPSTPNDSERPQNPSKAPASAPATCSEYSSSPVEKRTGNRGVSYDTVKILQSHFTAPLGDESKQDNRLTKETACAFSRLHKAARSAGFRLTINSGFRSIARQNYFWSCYKTGRCNNGNLAARPGTSNHGRGTAVDLDVTRGRIYQWLSQNAHKFGFVRTVASENWHWEFIPGAKRAYYT